MPSLIEAKGLDVNKQGKEILKDVSISVNKNDFITIIGPNGAGKSVLLECLMGTFSPDRGARDHARDDHVHLLPN